MANGDVIQIYEGHQALRPGTILTTVEVTAAEIAEGVTKQAIPALGAGKGPVIVTADFLYLAGTVPFGAVVEATLEPSGATQPYMVVGEAPVTSVYPRLARFALAVISNQLTQSAPVHLDELVNAAINLVLPAAGWRGAILTSAISDGGSGYEVGDTITLEAPAGTTAPVITVATVDGGGAVLTYTVTEAGTASPVGSVGQESTSGIGVDFMLEVLTVSEGSDGTGRLVVAYYVADLD